MRTVDICKHSVGFYHYHRSLKIIIIIGIFIQGSVVVVVVSSGFLVGGEAAVSGGGSPRVRRGVVVRWGGNILYLYILFLNFNY